MSILDLDNEQTLNVSEQRLGINADSSVHRGELFDTYASKAVCVKPEQSQHFTERTPDYVFAITEDGKLRSNGTICLKKDNRNLHQLFEDGVINSIQAPKFTTEQVTHLSRKNIGQNLTCGEFCGAGIIKVSGVKMDIEHGFDMLMVQDNDPHKDVVITNGVTFQYAGANSISFDDTEITFDPLVLSDKKYIRFSCFSQQPSDLKGLRSNRKKIVIYTLDDFPSELWNIFEPHDCPVIDSDKGCSVAIPIKTMKKAIAIANNPKRYTLRDHILKLKPEARLADILPTENFPELETFVIENNNVRLTFVNSALKENPEINYARVPAENLMKPTKDAYLQTTDGWYVVMSNKL